MSGRLMHSTGSMSHNIFDEASHGPGIMRAVLSRCAQIDYARYGSFAALVGLVPGAWGLLQQTCFEVSTWIKRFFIASVTIPGGDPLNRSVTTWLLDMIVEPLQTRFQTARTEIGRELEQGAALKKTQRAVQYCPHWRHLWFRNGNHLFMVHRSLKSFHSSMSDPTYDGIGGEELTISCLGRSAQPIRTFIDECRAYAERKTQFYVIIYSRDRYGMGWRPKSRKPLRQLDTVHFDEQLKKALLADVRTYLDPRTQKLYASRSMPYRRGYLFYGPPGTGKSSLCTALAGEFGLDLYEIKIPSVATDADLEQMFQEVPPRCIVLLEDIDAAWSGRDNSSRVSMTSSEHGSSLSNVTLSGLLNVLDGVGSQEGRVMIMTTNRPDQLDSALVRPGRVDFKLHLGNISPASAEQMFLRMFAPDMLQWAQQSLATTEKAGSALSTTTTDTLQEYVSMEQLKMLASDFSKAIPENILTPSQLQGFFQLHLDSAVGAAANIHAWVQNELAMSKTDFEEV